MKYLITIAVIAIAWLVIKWLARMQSGAADPRVGAPRGGIKWPPVFKNRREQALSTQDMAPCAACGAYVARARGGGQGCGRADCPQGV